MASNPPPPPSKHTAIASWVFGSILLLFYLGLFIFGPDELPEFKHKMLAIVSALLCALFTLFWVGSLNVTVQAKSKWSKIAIQSGGGAAAFVLVLWWWNNPDYAPVKSVQATSQTVTLVTATNGTINQISGNQTNYYGGSPELLVEIKKSGVTESALQNFFEILKEQNIKPEDYDHTLRQIADRYQNNVKELASFQSEDPEVKALLGQAEQALKQGEFVQAEALLNQAKSTDLAAAKKLQDTAAKRLLSAAEATVQNGELQLTQIHYVQAAQYYREAASIVPPEFAEKVAYYLNQAGEAWYSAGKYSEAEPLLQRSLAIREKALGEEHPDVATSLNNLAVLYKVQDKYIEAEPLYQRSLAILEKALGEDRPDFAVSLNNLALLYDDQGKYAEAEPLFQRSLAILEKNLGKDHPDVATSLNNLALFYDEQGKYIEAEPLYQRSLAILEKALGKDHPTTKTGRNNLQLLQAHLHGQLQVRVKTILPNNQAGQLGILAGDILTHYNNKSILAMDAFIYGRSIGVSH